ncbi:unnamed protein product [Oppiella nova]|uniref:Uncharacterized protein n=1 Tax=Oppiella nova TaxID=334625 RepID=A0A7R9QGW1_9ACAR|nr:unnamed protein product [Oppiella nova]CAG2165691.1 unnamed protein product [Oppiella nova]
MGGPVELKSDKNANICQIKNTSTSDSGGTEKPGEREEGQRAGAYHLNRDPEHSHWKDSEN